MIEIRRNIPNGNNAWPLDVKVTDKDVVIRHDVQRDGDFVSLTLAEWRSVAETVNKIVAAIEKTSRALDAELSE